MPQRDIGVDLNSRDWYDRAPIVSRYGIRLSAAQRKHCAAVAGSVRPARRLARDSHYFTPFSQSDTGPGPYIFFGDPAEITHRDIDRPRPMQYRQALLAGLGDLVVIADRRYPDFEAYVENRLGLGKRRYIRVETVRNGRYEPPQLRCLADRQAYRALCDFVESAGAATIVPYIALGATWTLARQLAIDTGLPVNVAGPLPSLTRVANDKIAFSRITRELFGAPAALPEVTAYGPAALAGKVHAIARQCRRLVVKLRDSAGGAGNYPMFSSDVAEMTLKELHRHLVNLLGPGAARIPFPLLVQVWENSVLLSPSLQLWIPHPADGAPVIEGAFSQAITGPEGRFAGAVPAHPDEPWLPRFVLEGMMLGQVFQDIGYFGRCSFDAVLSGDDLTKPDLHWVECNGRWGGVSTPMTLLNRLFNDGALPAYSIVHQTGLSLPRRTFSEATKTIENVLWRPGLGAGVIFLAPSGFEDGTGLQFVSLAADQSEADGQAARVFARLTDQGAGTS